MHESLKIIARLLGYTWMNAYENLKALAHDGIDENEANHWFEIKTTELSFLAIIVITNCPISFIIMDSLLTLKRVRHTHRFNCRD